KCKTLFIFELISFSDKMTTILKCSFMNSVTEKLEIEITVPKRMFGLNQKTEFEMRPYKNSFVF
ncbi:hypothetical protein, partial [Proteus faecis]|uniref:hypothetical protein n=1 Tax=Proteus faecis TaxID=2050967 RepID=UPI00301C3F7E